MKYIYFFLLVSNLSFAQSKTNINYLNEAPPGMVAKIFGLGSISSEEVEHSSPTFTADGKKVVWNIMKLPSYQIQLLEMNLVNGRWSKPKLPSFCDSISDYSFPSFSVDNKTLYFSSNKRIDKADTIAKGNRLWKVDLENGNWGVPKLVTGLDRYAGVFSSTIASNGNLYFTHGLFGSKDWNIISRIGNEFSALSTNTKDYEDGPYIHPLEEYLIFESDRVGSIDNSIDLYISFRKGDQWTEAINMGPKINTSFSERFARVSPDGKYLFFGSTRNGNFDIFWIDAKIIEELKKLTTNFIKK